jgi:hypothetical protein
VINEGAGCAPLQSAPQRRISKCSGRRRAVDSATGDHRAATNVPLLSCSSSRRATSAFRALSSGSWAAAGRKVWIAAAPHGVTSPRVEPLLAQPVCAMAQKKMAANNIYRFMGEALVRATARHPEYERDRAVLPGAECFCIRRNPGRAIRKKPVVPTSGERAVNRDGTRATELQ